MIPDDKVEILLDIRNRATKQLKKAESDFARFRQSAGRDIATKIDLKYAGQLQKFKADRKRMGKPITVPVLYKHLNKRARAGGPEADFFANIDSATRRASMFEGVDWSRRSMSQKAHARYMTGALGAGRAYERVHNWRTHKFTDGDRRNVKSLHSISQALIPRWHNVVNTFAALLPSILQLGVAAGGGILGIGAIGGAGATMLGLGLLGGGDTLEGSLQKAQIRLGDFKKDLFSTFKPLARLFEPFTNLFLKGLPGELAQLLGPLSNLTVFQGGFLRGIQGFVQWIGKGANEMVRFQPMLEELAFFFGAPFGDAIIQFLGWLTEEAYENREMLMALAESFVLILGALYNFTQLLARAVVVLRPLWKFLLFITELINNNFVAGLIAALLVIGKLIPAVKAMVLALRGLAVVQAFLTALKGGPVGLALVAGAAVAAGTAAGALSGSLVPNGDSSRPMNNVNMNIYGDPDAATVAKMEDVANSSFDSNMTRLSYMGS